MQNDLELTKDAKIKPMSYFADASPNAKQLSPKYTKIHVSAKQDML
jgi:hypothetical protein